MILCAHDQEPQDNCWFPNRCRDVRKSAHNISVTGLKQRRKTLGQVAEPCSDQQDAQDTRHEPDPEHLPVCVSSNWRRAVPSLTLISRLSDILFIQAVRAYFNGLADGKHDTGTGRWIRALNDPQIGSAIAFLHRQPDDWQVASLAYKVGMSRSSFSARFHELVGDPSGVLPMKNRFHSVANRRDRCTMVPFLRSKRKFRLQCAVLRA